MTDLRQDGPGQRCLCFPVPHSQFYPRLGHTTDFAPEDLPRVVAVGPDSHCSYCDFGWALDALVLSSLSTILDDQGREV